MKTQSRITSSHWGKEPSSERLKGCCQSSRVHLRCSLVVGLRPGLGPISACCYGASALVLLDAGIRGHESDCKALVSRYRASMSCQQLLVSAAGLHPLHAFSFACPVGWLCTSLLNRLYSSPCLQPHQAPKRFGPSELTLVSSPRSGPFRYDYVVPAESGDCSAAEGAAGHWVYHRDGRDLVQQLQQELQQLLGTAPSL